MKITGLRRLASLAGLLFLSLLLVAVFVQAGTPSGGDVSAAAASLPSSTALRAAAAELGQAGAVAARAPSPPSVTSSSTQWVVAGIVAAALIITIAVWATARSRKAEYCSIHPDNALCGVV
jgi:hypothetical protein